MNKQFYIEVLADLAAVIKTTKSKIYIFAGFTIDVWSNDILREHHDIDTICVDLKLHSDDIISFFESKDYKIIYVPNGDLKIKKNNFGISMTNCEIIENNANWTPYGVTGSIIFPSDWLVINPYKFNDFLLYTVDKKFEYCLKNNPSSFNPNWEPRDHSISLSYLRDSLIKENTAIDSFIHKMYLK